jgi:spore germination cell wall hydrolase CwlJ-like protein
MLPAPPPDVHAIALAVYHEARGEPYQCQLLVASVVINRMEARNKTAHGVISEPGQFKWYGKRKVKDGKSFRQSVAVAKKAVANPDISPYHYFHKGKRGGYRCGDQVFMVTYKRK